MGLRSKRILVRLAVHGGALMALSLGMLTLSVSQETGPAGVFALGAVAYLLTIRFNPVPQLVERSLLQQHECSACGEVFDLVGTWNCRCGFVSWHPRHALEPCPHCGGTFDYLHCPHCEQGVGV